MDAKSLTSAAGSTPKFRVGWIAPAACPAALGRGRPREDSGALEDDEDQEAAEDGRAAVRWREA